MVQKGTRRSCCFRPIYLKIQADSRPHSPERFPLIVQPPWRRAYLSVISRMDLNQGGNHFRRINPISPARIVCSEETFAAKTDSFVRREPSDYRHRHRNARCFQALAGLKSISMFSSLWISLKRARS